MIGFGRVYHADGKHVFAHMSYIVLVMGIVRTGTYPRVATCPDIIIAVFCLGLYHIMTGTDQSGGIR